MVATGRCRRRPPPRSPPRHRCPPPSILPSGRAKPLQGPAGAFLYGTLTTPPGGDPYADPSTPPVRTPGPGLGTQILSNIAGDMWSPSDPEGRLGVAPPIRDLAARQQIADGERATRDHADMVVVTNESFLAAGFTDSGQARRAGGAGASGW